MDRPRELFTYNELREQAIKEGIADNKVSVGLWAKINGYYKTKREIRDNKFVWLYTKNND